MKALKTIPVLVFCSIFSSIFITYAHSAESGTKSSQDQLAYARSLARQGDVDEAIEQYLKYYGENPEKHSVLLTISGLYENSKRFKEAIDFVERFIVTRQS